MQTGLKQFLQKADKALQSLAERLERVAKDPYNRRPLSAAEKAAAHLEEEAELAELEGFGRAVGAVRHTLHSCNLGQVELDPSHLKALNQAWTWLQECLKALRESQAETALPQEDWLKLLQSPETLSDDGSTRTLPASPSGPDISLDDLAALLVQLDPDDLCGLERIDCGLEELAACQPGSSQAGELLKTASEKLHKAVQADSLKARADLISEAGLYVDAASDSIEAAPGSPPLTVAPSQASSESEAGVQGEGKSRSISQNSEFKSLNDETPGSPSDPEALGLEPWSWDPASGIEEILRLLNAKEAEESLDLDSLRASLQALSRDSSYPAEVQELLSQAAERCLGFEGPPDEKGGLIAEIGLCLDAACDMLDSPPRPSDDRQPAMGQARQGASAEPTPGEESAASEKHLFVELPDDTDAELMGEFITESNEAIDAAEASLLDLETSPQDLEAVNTVFRSFHTIKGTSAFLGLEVISHLAHLAENLLSRIREQEIVCAGGYADLALRSVDILKELLQGVQDALGGQATRVPETYHALTTLLEDPEAHGISDESFDTATPSARLGDILVSQGKADRQEVEIVAASKGEVQLGQALVKSSTAKVSDVAQALRSQKRSTSPDASVRVRTERLDSLIDMVGELVIAHSMVAQDEMILDRTHYDTARKVNHAGKIVRELQDLCMSLRMIPMRAVFQKMARLMRDLSRKIGKQVEFATEGEETEIDRNMVDIIGDPLVHMVRNAVDHGIEMPRQRREAGKPAAGRVSLKAYHAGGNVIVELKDDGRGLDRERIAAKAVANGLIESAEGLSDREVFDLIFAPGFSTAQEITDVSGRGVGMDVVRRSIESLRGRVQISSRLGKGSTFTIVLPLTLAITDGMLIRVGSERFIIPTVNIFKSFRPEPDSLSTVAGRGEMVLLRDELMPIYRLHRLFEVENAVHDPTQGILVVVGDGHKRSAVLVDELLGQQQVVAKSLGGGGLGQVKGVSGAAILGDGRVGLILDTTGLIELAQQNLAKPILPEELSNFANGASAQCR